MSRRRTSAAWLLALLLLPACGDKTAANPADSYPEWAVSEELRFGSLDDPDYGLSNVGAVRVDGAGERVAVSQPQENVVRLFDSDGQAVGVVGMEGKGPGEFQGIARVGFEDELLWVSEGDRVQWFDRGGALAGSRRLSFDLPEPLLTPYGVTMLADGNEMAWPNLPIAAFPDYTAKPVAIVDSVGTVLSLIDGGPIPGVAYPIPRRPSIVPFTYVFTVGVQPDGRSIVVVEDHRSESPDAGEMVLKRYDARGSVVDSGSVAFRPIAVPDPMPDSVLAREAELTRQPLEILRTMVDEGDVPPFYHAVDRVVVSSEGEIFARRHGSVPSTWLVFDPDLNPVSRVSFPRGFDLHAAHGNDLWGVWKDPLDVPYVVKYRLHRDFRGLN